MSNRPIQWRTMGDDTSDDIADSLVAAGSAEVASETAQVAQEQSGTSSGMSTTTMLLIGAAVLGGLYLLGGKK